MQEQPLLQSEPPDGVASTDGTLGTGADRTEVVNVDDAHVSVLERERETPIVKTPRLREPSIDDQLLMHVLGGASESFQRFKQWWQYDLNTKLWAQVSGGRGVRQRRGCHEKVVGACFL